MDEKIRTRKTDRRTIYTRNTIKDALLELLADTTFDRITVTALCKQAEITRATFYLHYDNLDEVLNELLDDALRLTELEPEYTVSASSPDFVHVSSDPDALLPACQRAASNPKYKALFMDESLSHYILNKLFQIQKPQRIPEIMKEYHVTEWEAEKLLLFMLNGNFAVNKSLGWNRSSDWYRIQNIIQKLMQPV